MRKVKTKKKLIPLLLAVIATFSIFLYAKSISAELAVNEEASVKLNIEKVDRDTIKIALDDFEPNIKSLQFGLKIDGNANFVEDGIKSLVTSNDENMKTNVKISDDKKGMEIFIVSTEALDRKSTKFEICEVDLEKATDKKTGFSITPYSTDSTGAAITYILSETNKREEQVLATEAQTININSTPKIELKESKFVIDGEIILTKGKTFKAEEYVNVTDEDGTFELSHNGGSVKINTVGVYNVTYTATDDYGDSTTLQVPVVVEEADSLPIINIENSQIVDSTITVNEGEEINLLEGITAQDFRGREVEVKVEGDYDFNKADIYPIKLVAEDIHGNIGELPLVLVVKGEEQPIVNPIITITNKTIKVKKGETVDLLEGVKAIDYLGQEITVEVSGDYNFNEVGTYTIKYNATDSLGNKAEEVTATLIVEGDTNTSEPETPEQPELPENPEISLPDDIINIGGNGTEEAPMTYETENLVSLNKLLQQAQEKFKVIVTNRTVLDNGTQKYSIRLDKKGIIARLLGVTNSYYVEVIVPNTDEFNSVFSKLEKDDKEAPVIEYNGELNIILENGAIFDVPEVIAKDNLDTDVIVKVVLKDSNSEVVEKIDTTKAGTYTITYIAEDESGNKSEELIITVTINESNVVPEIPDSNDEGITVTPEKPDSNDQGITVTPENPEDSNKVNNSTDKQETLDKNEGDLPTTGQGVYFGVIIIAAIILIGLGIFMIPRKKYKH